MKRSNLTLVFYLSLVFVSGLLVGGFGARLFCTKTVAAAPAHLTPDQYRKQYVDTMNERLRLTSDQSKQLDAVLDKTRERFHELKQKQTDEINAMLTPEQQVEYSKLRKEREDRRKLEERQQQQQQKPAQ